MADQQPPDYAERGRRLYEYLDSGQAGPPDTDETKTYFLRHTVGGKIETNSTGVGDMTDRARNPLFRRDEGGVVGIPSNDRHPVPGVDPAELPIDENAIPADPSRVGDGLLGELHDKLKVAEVPDDNDKPSSNEDLHWLARLAKIFNLYQR